MCMIESHKLLAHGVKWSYSWTKCLEAIPVVVHIEHTERFPTHYVSFHKCDIYCGLYDLINGPFCSFCYIFSFLFSKLYLPLRTAYTYPYEFRYNRTVNVPEFLWYQNLDTEPPKNISFA